MADNQLFRKEALAYRSQRLDGSISLATPLSWQIISALFIAGLIAIMVFLMSGSYSRVEVVRGVVTLDRAIAQVSPTRAGIVGKVHVEEGAFVMEGAPIVDIQTDQYIAKGGLPASDRLNSALGSQVEQLRNQENFLAAASKANVLRLTNELHGLQKEVESLESQRTDELRLLKVAEDNVESVQKIIDRGFISKRDLQQRESDVISRRQNVSRLDQQIAAKKSSIQATRALIDEQAASASGQIEAVRSGRTALEQRSVELELQESYSLVSSINGRVTALTARVGSEAELGRPLAMIIPEDADLHVELYVSTGAIGFVEVGQEVKIAVDAYSFQTFGTLQGRVKQIAGAPMERSTPGATEPVYLVRVELERDHISAFGNKRKLLPGMTLTARVATEKRTLFEWLFEPLYAVINR